MLTAKDVAEVLALSLSSPGMDDQVKINFRASRKTVLLIAKAIDIGLSAKDGTDGAGLFAAAGEQNVEAIHGISAEILANAGLSDMYQKLNSLQTKS